MTESTVLIADTPATEDKFEAHQRIATGIVELILTEKGGKTISIEGEWGSGKSTVIKLIEKELKLENQIKILVYDAWVHSGDPLRRVFLETLVDQLMQEKWLIEPDSAHLKKYPARLDSPFHNKNKPYWQRKKEELTGRYKVSQKTTTPKINAWGKWLIGTLMFFPIGTYIFGNLLIGYLKNQWLFNMQPSLFYLFVASIFVAFSPLLLLFLSRIFANDKEQFWSFIANKTINEEETSTLDTPEPSSIEFQQLFYEALDMALSRNDRKLIIVIDNLDRLRTDQAEAVWSMLRSFIDDLVLQSKNAEWTKKLWLLVPVAKNFNQVNPDKDENDKSPAQSEQFLEKVFQVRFSLPSPVFENWQRYLKELVERALPGTTQSDVSEITRLYESHLGLNVGKQLLIPSAGPTPRSLIHYVNDIAVLKLIWKDIFSVPMLAAYTLNTKYIDVLKHLREGNIPTSETIRIIGQKALRDFPAIYFSVEDTDKAQELLKRPELKMLLQTGNGKDLLEELIANPYLESVLIHLVEELIDTSSKTNYLSFMNIILALGFCYDLDNQPPEKQYKFKNHSLDFYQTKVMNGYANLKALPLANENFCESLRLAFLIVDKLPLEQVILDKLKTLASTPSHQVVAEIPNAESTAWWNQLDLLISLPRINALLELQTDNSIRLPISKENWPQFYSRETDTLIYSKMRPAIPNSEICEHLITQTEGLDYEIFKALQRERIHGDISSFSSLANSLQQLINSSHSAMEMENLDATISTLLILRNHDQKFEHALHSLVASGIMHSVYSYAISKKHFVTASVCLISINLYKKLGDPVLNVANSSAGHTAIKALYQSPEDFSEHIAEYLNQIDILGEERIIIEVVKDPAASAFIQTTYELLDDKTNLFNAFDTTKLFQEIFIFTQKFDKSDEIRTSIIRHYLVNHNLMNQVMSDKFDLTNAWRYRHIVENKDLVSTEFLRKIKSLLTKIRPPRWLKSISDRDELTKLSIALEKCKVNIGYGKLGRLGLQEYILQCLNSSKPLQRQSTIPHFVRNLNPHEIKDFYKFLINTVLNLSKAAPQDFWETLVDYLHLGLKKNADTSLLYRQLVGRAVDLQDIGFLDFVSTAGISLSKKDVDPTNIGWKPIRLKLGKLTSNRDCKTAAYKLKKIIKVSKPRKS